MHTLFLIATLIPVVAVGALRQDPSPESPPAEKAKVTGRVTGPDGRPLAHANVHAWPSAQTKTDRSGVYKLEVAPGKYEFRSDKRGYITSYGVDGQEEAAELTLGPGQTLANVDFRLGRGGVITGRVVDEENEPLVGVEVRALTKKKGYKGYLPSSMLRTSADDRGQYRVFALSPGRHLIQVVLADPRPPMQSEAGESAVTAGTYYYPGVSQQKQAIEVQVSEGSEATGIDIKISRSSRTATLTGSVTRKDLGRPMANVEASVWTSENGGSSFKLNTDDAGKFEIQDLAPGIYLASVNARTLPEAEGLSWPTSKQFKVSTGENEISFEFERAAEISGRVIMEGGKVPDNVSQLYVRSWPLDATPLGGYPGRPDQQGHFKLERLGPGTYKFIVNLVNGAIPVFIKSVLQDDRDVRDLGVSVSAGERVSDLVLVVSDGGGKITGTVVSPQGKAVPDSAVILLPADFEQQGIASLRERRDGRSDRTGRYSLTMVAPGRYVVAAFAGDSMVPSYEESFAHFVRSKPNFTQLEVKSGEARELNLIPLPAAQP